MHLKKTDQQGFTLIEVAMVTIIGGLLLGAFSTALLSYIQQTRITTTEKRLDTINAAMQQYIAIHGVLPCPASRTVKIDQAGFALSVETDTDPDPEVHHCDTSDTLSGVSYLKSPEPPYTPPGGGAPYQLYIRVGDVPTRTLNLPDEVLADAWGSRFVYAVTQNLTNPNTFYQDSGGIHVEDSNSNPVNSKVQYLLFSVGPDRIGGRTFDTAKSTGSCDTTTLDGGNCKYLTVGSGATATPFIKTIMDSNQTGATHYDDLMLMGIQTQAAQLIPSGAVMAFDMPPGITTCPTGWTEFTTGGGRFIVGYSATTPAPGLTQDYNSIGATGGGSEILSTLATALFTHQHHVGKQASLNHITTTGAGGSDITYIDPVTAAGTDVDTDLVGGTTSIDNRPPYVILLYCKKN